LKEVLRRRAAKTSLSEQRGKRERERERERENLYVHPRIPRGAPDRACINTRERERVEI